MSKNASNDVVAVYIFKALTGATLYSKKILILHDDLFAAFISAIRTFFSNFLLGGLTLFSSDKYIIYFASKNDLLTTVIVESKNKSIKYFSLANTISEMFYRDYKSIVEDHTPLIPTHKIKFDEKLLEIMDAYNAALDIPKEILKFYQLDDKSNGKEFSFISVDHLYSIPLFLVLNLVTNQIFILENDSALPSKTVFHANNFAVNLNQREYKSQFHIRNVSGPWDCERLISEFRDIIHGRQITIQ